MSGFVGKLAELDAKKQLTKYASVAQLPAAYGYSCVGHTRQGSVSNFLPSIFF